MSDSVPVADLLRRFPGGRPKGRRATLHPLRPPPHPPGRGAPQPQLAGRVDGEDVVQSVFRTFFRRTADGEFRLDGSAQLWRLLVRITLRKARATGRVTRPTRRRLEAAGDDWLLEAVAHDPGPAEAAALVDQIEASLHGLPPSTAGSWTSAAGARRHGDRRHAGLSRRTVHRASSSCSTGWTSTPGRRSEFALSCPTCCPRRNGQVGPAAQRRRQGSVGRIDMQATILPGGLSESSGNSWSPGWWSSTRPGRGAAGRRGPRLPPPGDPLRRRP